MMKRLTVISTALLFVSLSLNISHANVLVEDVDVASDVGSLPNTVQIGTGEGQRGNYVLIACSTLSDGSNDFVPLTPGTWTLLDSGHCDAGASCIQGIWGSFTDNPNDEQITCSSTQGTSVFVAGSFRYSGADADSPIIDVGCSTGTSLTPTAPSIIAEAGSQVVRFYTWVRLEQMQMVEANSSETRSFFASRNSAEGNITIRGSTSLTQTSGPTGTATPTTVAPSVVSDWRACTLAIRMQPAAIPALSEWGIGAFVLLLGAASLLALRRRSAGA